MKTLCFLVILALAFTAGWFCAIDHCNGFVAEQIPIVQPEYTPTKYYRYGGGDAFEDQMNRIRLEGKQEFRAAWDEFTVDLWPWKGVL
jgi:hypothetical protein